MEESHINNVHATCGRVTVVVGGQFGSEAKGKVVSHLAKEFDMAVRTGSPNAGHTVIDGGKTYKLQQIPATFINSKCQLFIGAGALIDPIILAREAELLGVKRRLYIDHQAGIIEKKHIMNERDLISSIGSTGKGCGAALADRIWRSGFKLAKDTLLNYQLVNVSEQLNIGINQGKHLLIEGTQGFGLSIYHGIYPYVTSRDTTAANFLAESGISPMLVSDIILVIRTYPIRVAGNSGPINNEISWDTLSEHVGRLVKETTTVTGRLRRVADFDIELVRSAIQVNRPTQIALQFLNYKFPCDEGKSNWDSLSSEARCYICSLESKIGVPITLIGTSSQPEGMIDRRIR